MKSLKIECIFKKKIYSKIYYNYVMKININYNIILNKRYY